MRILIIDDSLSKIVRIQDSLTELVPDAELSVVGSFWDAKDELINNKFDFIICDMQFPETTHGRIERECGIKVLDMLAQARIDTPVIIASSDVNVSVLLEERNFGHIPSIKASSMYCLTSQLEPYLDNLTTIVKDEKQMLHDLHKTNFRNISIPKPIFEKTKTKEDHDRIKKAQLKREKKQEKKNKYKRI